ncbi:MAG: sensor histidine kinase [Anaerolineales bacterium]
MPSNEAPRQLFEGNTRDAAQDLHSTFVFAGVLVVCLAVLILASNENIIALQIPPTELLIVALLALLVTVGGLWGLQQGWAARPLARGSLILYTLILSAAVHFTGGPQTPFPAVYLVVILGGSFLLGRGEATALAILSMVCYAIVLYLEYSGALEMVQIWGTAFPVESRGALLIINWFTLAIPTFTTAQLAGTLAERLRRSNLQLRRSEELRQSLSDMIVHDLRNPLTALLGGLDMLNITMGTELNSDQQRLLENTRHSGHVLLGLVGELLDISKLEAGQFTLHLQPVDVRVILEENARDFQALSVMEKQEVIVERHQAKRSVMCDRQLISRVIANLLSNAIKHTPRGGTIRLASQEIDNTIQVSISDTGTGIPRTHHQQIFEKYGQVQSQSSLRRGTGLGLTFCKMVVEAHGGRIWVESDVGQGSTFHFTLPLR